MVSSGEPRGEIDNYESSHLIKNKSSKELYGQYKHLPLLKTTSMRLHSTAAFWALLASSAPASITAQGRRLRRNLKAKNECTIVAAERLAEKGVKDLDDMSIECELHPSDANGYSGITVPINASASQIAELKTLIETGSITSGVDKLDIVGESIIGAGFGSPGVSEMVSLSSDVSIKAKLRNATARGKSQRRLGDTSGTLKMLLVRVKDSNGKVYPDLPTVMR